MKTLANRLVIFTAGATLLGTMAYGQEHLKAEIPFAFGAANAPLPAGHYEFDSPSIQGATTTIRLLNADSHKTVAVLSLPLDTYYKANDAPTAEFVCDGERCQLSAIKTNAGTYRYPVPHKSGQNKEGVAVLKVQLAGVNGR